MSVNLADLDNLPDNFKDDNGNVYSHPIYKKDFQSFVESSPNFPDLLKGTLNNSALQTIGNTRKSVVIADDKDKLWYVNQLQKYYTGEDSSSDPESDINDYNINWSPKQQEFQDVKSDSDPEISTSTEAQTALEGNDLEVVQETCKTIELLLKDIESIDAPPYTIPMEHDENNKNMEFDTEGNHYSQSLHHGVNENQEPMNTIFQGNWPVDKGLWNSGPPALEKHRMDASSLMSFSSSIASMGSRRSQSQTVLGTKVEMVYNLLSMLGSHSKEEMSKTLLAMSSSPDNCITMRQSGCIPLLIQLLHGDQTAGSVLNCQIDGDSRLRASQALHNIVHSHPDDKRGRREARVLKLLEQIRDYCDYLRSQLISLGGQGPLTDDDMEKHPGPAIAVLLKLSFDEEHRHAMCQLGGLPAIAELTRVDHECHGGTTADKYCVTLRRYSGMTLTNLTFGDGTNKALLCSYKGFMRALVSQLHSPSEDLRQVTASVLRNLSWRANQNSKQVLREVGAVTALMTAAVEATKESTMKATLSALWNLSAHCSLNKADICAIDGALEFLVKTLNYKSQSKTLAIVESGGGILRNISSHIAVREEYRKLLREHDCLNILLEHLRSPSLTIVSNACGALWNLSARCPEDQQTLRDLGAVSMLRSLVHSKHKMISMGSSAALKNLLSSQPSCLSIGDAKSNGLPSLQARKQKNLEQELDPNLSETCDNIESGSPHNSPTSKDFPKSDSDSVDFDRINFQGRLYHSLGGNHFVPKDRSRNFSISRSGSHESVGSTHSDTVFERRRRHIDTDYPVSEYSDMIYPPGLQKLKKSLEAQGITNGKIYEAMQEAASQAGLNLSELDCFLAQNNDPSHSLALKISKLHQRYLDSGVLTSEFDSVPNGTPDSGKNTRETGTQPDIVPTKLCYRRPATPPPSRLPTRLVKPKKPLEDEKPTNKLTPTRIPTKTGDVPSCYPPPKCPSKSVGRRSKNKKKSDRTHTMKIDFNSSDVRVYNCYTETDLDNPDQPTDYSQIYSEGSDDAQHYQGLNTKSEEGSPHVYFNLPSGEPSVHDDTVRTYCTEGTPYEGTPCNFSTATSMSDLREDSLLSADQVKAEARKPGKDSSKPSNCSETGSPIVVKDPQSLSAIKGPKLASTPIASVVKPQAIKNVNEEHISGETPLMFSRCSSLGSLSSVEQQSIHDDRSSIISDFSRLTSGAISPSDLPDSPSQTIPPSPKRVRHPAEMQDKKPKERVDVFTERTRQFKEEGTPATFSGATSLSSISFCGNQKKRSNDDAADETSKAQNKDDWSEDDENSEDLLAACINSAMPKNSSASTRKERLPTPKSGIPKMNLAVVKPNNAISSNQSSRFTEDTVQKYCTEGTPVTLSQAGSYGNLSTLSIPGETASSKAGDKAKGKSLLEVHKSAWSNTSELGSVSDNSSVGEDDQQMLNQCIQSAMPKSKLTNGMQVSSDIRPESPRKATASLANSSKPSGIPARILKKEAWNEGKNVKLNTEDQTIAYATEGTPLQFSNATSLSDLTIESNTSLPRDHSEVITPGLSSGSNNVFYSPAHPTPRDDLSYDSPLRYAVEGTPITFSRQDSLSTLSYEDEDALSEGPPRSIDKNEKKAFETAPFSASNAEEAKRAVQVVTGVVRGTASKPSQAKSCADHPEVAVSPSEQALLDQCISVGMPKSKTENSGIKKPRFRRQDIPRSLVVPTPKKSDVLSATETTMSDDDLCPGDTTLNGSGSKIPVMKLEKVSLPKLHGIDVKKYLEGKDDSSPERSPSSDHKSPESEKKSGDSPKNLLLEQSTTSIFSEMDKSLPSDLLDNIKPPSGLSSLASSFSNSCEISDRGNGRKYDMNRSDSKGTKVPEMVRRALGNNFDVMKSSGGSEMLDNIRAPSNFSSIDNLSLSSSTSNLDNVKPPSAMEDIEMDNSMISVASIGSEIAENRSGSGSDHRSLKSSGNSDVMFEMMRPLITMVEMCFLEEDQNNATVSTRSSGPSELDNVNPPSDFNDLPDLTEHDSTIEPLTDTFCSDNEYDDIPRDDDDKTIPHTPSLSSQSTGTLVGLSDEDSWSSTPATGSSSQDSTPKARKKLSMKQRRLSDRDRYRTYTVRGDPLQPKKGDLSSTVRQNIKDRRKNDQSRFLTQTVLKSDLELAGVGPRNSEEPNSSSSGQVTGSSYRNSGEMSETEMSGFNNSNEDLGLELDMTAEEMEAVKKEANKVISTLNESKPDLINDCERYSDNGTLDCETLSLVSNESESESGQITFSFAGVTVTRKVNASNEDYDTDDDPIVSSHDTKPPIRRARITKPSDKPEPQPEENVKVVRGRRRALYSGSKRTSSATSGSHSSPRSVSSSGGSRSGSPNITPSPKSVRPTRASQLRQTNSLCKINTPANPKVVSSATKYSGAIRQASSSSRNSSSSPASRSTKAGEVVESEVEEPKVRLVLVKQGTFTKENNTSQNDSSSSGIPMAQCKEKKIPPKVPPKPKLPRDSGIPRRSLCHSKSQQEIAACQTGNPASVRREMTSIEQFRKACLQTRSKLNTGIPRPGSCVSPAGLRGTNKSSLNNLPVVLKKYVL